MAGTGRRASDRPRMTRYYVSLRGIPEDDLAFFGIQIVFQTETHALLADHRGDEHVIEKASPHIYVEDVNDAEYLREWVNEIVVIPD